MRTTKQRLLIVGNGPSLKTDFFPLFCDFPCLGMNAAYRYWERIGWFPDYYCCLDDQVITSHAGKIREMIIGAKCKKFLLHHNFLEIYPDLANRDDVTALCQLVPGVGNERSCAKLGIPHTPSNIFRSRQPAKLTTGAYAVRFAAHEGFAGIGLIGIDCRYVELIPESKVVDGIVLEIKQTPKQNPNYFFGDYQVAGDRYNIPNPKVHQGNLHLQSFEALREDIVFYELDLDVRVCTKDSELYAQDVFPYVPLNDFVRGAYLSALMVPFTKRDIHSLLDRLQSWGHEELAPFDIATGNSRVSLFLCFNAKADEAMEQRFRAVFDSAGLGRFFTSLRFFYSELSGLRDLYTRENNGEFGPEGYAAGPNNQFFDIITRFSRGMAHIMLMEADVAPLRAGWLRRLEDICRSPDRFWICGSHYRGIGRVIAFYQINGNALYNVGDPAFLDFIEEIFIPYFRDTVQRIPNLPYDVVLYRFFEALFAGKADDDQRRHWQIIAHRIRFSEFIVNLSHDDDRRQERLLGWEQACAAFPDAVLFHGATGRIDTDIARSIRHDDRPAARLVYIDCDAVDNWGHFLSYELRLANAATARGLDFLILGNKKIDPEIHPLLAGKIKPIFADHSWLRDEAAIERFSARLREALDTLSRDDPRQVFLYMYTAGLEHAEAIFHELADRPRIVANVNLFWSYLLNERDSSAVERWRSFVTTCDKHPRINITVPTERLQHVFRSAFGVFLPIAPHPSTTYPDGQARALAAGAEHVLSGTPTVLFPGGVQTEKGFNLSTDAARGLRGEHGLQTVVRAVVRADTPQDLVAEVDQLESIGVEVARDSLDETGFQQLLDRADVVVCPYLPSSFARRTSGLVVDSILLGRPFVALKGTWLGELARSSGAGLAVDATAVAIRDGVLRLIAEYRDFSANAAKARRAYLSENSWASLVDSIVEGYLEKGRSSAVDKTTPSGRPLKHAGDPTAGVGVRCEILLGPNSRERPAHFDETDCIAQLFNTVLTGKVMIDVGAHHGYAHAPFLDRQWQIFAFEPDQSNRAKLLDRLAKHKHRSLVTLDTRCVSNQSQTGVSFFTSEQSTGISGLSAFHETHKESQKVDITTLTEFFQDRPMSAIDFLKIDTEGHDLFVLQGYPWERGQPAVIECEFEDTKTVPLGYSFHDLARYLLDKGYRVYVSEWHPIIRYGIRHDWRALMRYPCELADPKGWGNLLAFREPIDEQALVAAVKKVMQVADGGAAKVLSKPVSLPVSAATISSLSGKPTFRFEPSPHFVQTTPNQWCYKDAEAKQKLWVAVLDQPVSAGQERVGGLRIQVDRAMTVNVSLGRHWSTDYEGATQRIKLAPGVAQSVKLVNLFGKPHTALKLQVDVLELPGGGSANLIFDELFITESLAAAQRRLGDEPFTLREANRLCREGERSLALQMYLQLYDQRSLQMYADNALHTARKLGLGQFKTIADLRQRAPASKWNL
jgi:FkbM family methyltransferase